MRTINREIVSAVIISRDGKLLQAHKNFSGVYPDCWGIIGGGIDSGEEKREALNREVMEEAGLDIGRRRTVLQDRPPES